MRCGTDPPPDHREEQLVLCVELMMRRIKGRNGENQENTSNGLNRFSIPHHYSLETEIRRGRANKHYFT
jgi:hypothetical protein